MFWKKKSKETGKKLFKNPTETRGAFRVYPSEENPILLKVGSTALKAVDISAGGISFDNKAFKLGAKYPMEITLPKGKGHFKVETEILKIDDKNVCRCKIVGLDPEQEDSIHSYILGRQKEEIAQKKYKG
ncbi:MAG: PilZ domain-containing protein [Nitrospinae bacterium]|nr:PilZ domain-containing protein [Nitrospinota bacterium]